MMQFKSGVWQTVCLQLKTVLHCYRKTKVISTRQRIILRHPFVYLASKLKAVLKMQLYLLCFIHFKITVKIFLLMCFFIVRNEYLFQYCAKILHFQLDLIEGTLKYEQLACDQFQTVVEIVNMAVFLVFPSKILLSSRSPK